MVLAPKGLVAGEDDLSQVDVAPSHENGAAHARRAAAWPDEPPCPKPFCSVRPLIDTAPPPMKNKRVALPPSIASALAPGPEMVRLSSMRSRLVSAITPSTEKIDGGSAAGIVHRIAQAIVARLGNGDGITLGFRHCSVVTVV